MMSPGEALCPRRDFLLPSQPHDFPGLVAFWRFRESGDCFRAEQGEPYELRSGVGPLTVAREAAAPLGGRALQLQEGQWLSVGRAACPALDFHGPTGQFTLLAWLRREPTRSHHCEFIAGQWNETQAGRQYGLFLNIGVWGVGHRVFGHLSTGGGPTPGYRYCMDGCLGASPVPHGAWVTVGMSYDGHAGYAWYNGLLDYCPPLNPYPLAGGLHDGGPGGSDFTVGGVHRAGEMGNFFVGGLAGLAVYRRALTPAEIFALGQISFPTADHPAVPTIPPGGGTVASPPSRGCRS